MGPHPIALVSSEEETHEECACSQSKGHGRTQGPSGSQGQASGETSPAGPLVSDAELPGLRENGFLLLELLVCVFCHGSRADQRGGPFVLSLCSQALAYRLPGPSSSSVCHLLQDLPRPAYPSQPDSPTLDHTVLLPLPRGAHRCLEFLLLSPLFPEPPSPLRCQLQKRKIPVCLVR